MLLTLIINTNYLPLLPASLCFTHRELLTFRYCSTASRKIADRETLRQPRSLFSRLIASSDK